MPFRILDPMQVWVECMGHRYMIPSDLDVDIDRAPASLAELNNNLQGFVGDYEADAYPFLFVIGNDDENSAEPTRAEDERKAGRENRNDTNGPDELDAFLATFHIK